MPKIVPSKTQTIVFKTAGFFTLATAVLGVALLVLKLTKGQWLETHLTKKLYSLYCWQVLCGVPSGALIFTLWALIILHKQRQSQTQPSSEPVLSNEPSNRILPENPVATLNGANKEGQGVKHQVTIDIDDAKLTEIFGYKPGVQVKHCIQDITFINNVMEISTGLRYTIVGIKQIYQIWPSGFSKTIGSSLELAGDGCFEGSWDDHGKKLAALFFANQQNGAIIYFNGGRRCLQKMPSGEVDFPAAL